MEYSSILITIVIVVVFYLFFGAFLYFFQNSMIYFPDNQDFEDCPHLLDYEKLNHEGTRFYLKRQSNDLIVYYHGNAGSACDRGRFKSVFERTNKSVMFVEYAGYSADNRRPSTRLILQDVENVNDFILNEGFENVIVYGQSIGSGAASYHASLARVKGVVLTSPFDSLKNVAQSKYIIYPAGLLLRENYDNVNWLSNHEGFVHIFHGTADSIIPSRFSLSLYNQISGEDKHYELIDGFGHNDIWNSQEFRNRLSEVLSR